MMIDIMVVMWLVQAMDWNALAVKYQCDKWMFDGFETVCVDEGSPYYGCEVNRGFCSEEYLKEWEDSLVVGIPQGLKR